jgi:hypothetical protein
MLLSIDCGIKNLAMCLIDPKDKKIHKWEVSGVPPMHALGVFPCLVNHLNDRPWILDSTTVVIEKQPDRNRSIKAVENLLHTYFLVHKKEVVIYDARHKIPDVVGAGKEKYIQRKKAAVDRARKFIQMSPNNKEWLPLFEKSKKKDDLADTVMQAIAFIDRVPTKAEKEKEKPKKLAPRKPTENQIRTKYSKANLAYIVKNGLKQDARFVKDLARYYLNISELMKEFNI